MVVLWSSWFGCVADEEDWKRRRYSVASENNKRIIQLYRDQLPVSIILSPLLLFLNFFNLLVALGHSPKNLQSLKGKSESTYSNHCSPQSEGKLRERERETVIKRTNIRKGQGKSIQTDISTDPKKFHTEVGREREREGERERIGREKIWCCMH